MANDADPAHALFLRTGHDSGHMLVLGQVVCAQMDFCFVVFCRQCCQPCFHACAGDDILIPVQGTVKIDHNIHHRWLDRVGMRDRTGQVQRCHMVLDGNGEMNMMIKTSMTSISGVMFISIIGSSLVAAAKLRVAGIPMASLLLSLAGGKDGRPEIDFIERLSVQQAISGLWPAIVACYLWQPCPAARAKKMPGQAPALISVERAGARMWISR